jgi:dCMP deaminase
MLDLAHTVSQWSKGPRKRVGAVVMRPDRSVASMGYNGPPRGYDDAKFLNLPREDQHKIVVHAEANAIYHLQDSDKKALQDNDNGYTIYIFGMEVCQRCAMLVRHAGFRRAIAYCGHNETSKDWEASALEAKAYFDSDGIKYLRVQT